MANILIVDDSDTLRIQLKSVLEECGHSVIEAVNGFDGLEKVKANDEIDLLISDFNMPELDGISMCKRIKEQSLLPNKPIFMLTTETSVELKSLGKEAGVMAWIVKPFQPKKLTEVVEKVLSRNK